jgi:flagellar hook protein FlgE
MFTGVSGLLNQAEAMNVIGNNISNVNTIGFKGSRTLFSDVLSTSVSGGSQLGHGVQLQKIDNLFTQSSFDPSGNVTDLAIQGDSFFAVKDPNITSPVNQDGAMLTRSGAFRIDNNLNLVNPDGYQVLDTQGNPIKFSDNATAISTINSALTTQCTTPATVINTQATSLITPADTFATAVLTAAAAAFTAQSATIVTSATTFQAVPGGTTAEASAQAAILAAANAAATAAATATGSPVASNIAAAQAKFDTLNTLVNNSTFTTTDISTAFDAFKASLAAVNTQNITDAPSAQINRAIAIKTAATAARDAAIAASSNPTPGTLGAAQSAFESLSTLTNNSTFTPAAFSTAYTTFSGLLGTAKTAVDTAITTATPLIESAQTQLATAKGLAFGKISSIDASGMITYLGLDGKTVNFYNISGQAGVAANATNAAGVQRLAVVKVANQAGLEKAGGTLYKPTAESGVSATAFSLTSNSANGTSEMIKEYNLEQSNVDMANEFVKMILTQRAYSANSKTITTADEMTQEVLNLKR